ncbi:MAG: OmpA family protein [Pseudomonadota bacterium]
MSFEFLRRRALTPMIAIGALALTGCAEEVGLMSGGSAVLGGAYTANKIIHTAPSELTNEEMREVAKLAEDFTSSVDDIAYFDFDRSTLRADARSILRAQAEWLLRHPRAAVRIYGHTDKVGPESYNEGLGMRRAESAARYLERAGISPNRFQFVESVGEREPVVKTEDREPRNRRTETIVMGLSVDGGPMRTAQVFDGRRAHRVFERYATDSVETPRAAKTSDLVQEQ